MLVEYRINAASATKTWVPPRIGGWQWYYLDRTSYTRAKDRYRSMSRDFLFTENPDPIVNAGLNSHFLTTRSPSSWHGLAKPCMTCYGNTLRGTETNQQTHNGCPMVTLVASAIWLCPRNLWLIYLISVLNMPNEKSSQIDPLLEEQKPQADIPRQRANAGRKLLSPWCHVAKTCHNDYSSKTCKIERGRSQWSEIYHVRPGDSKHT